MHRKGFTLIELSIVVVIIGILASLAGVRYQKVMKRTKAAEALIIMEKAHAGYQMIKFDQGDAAATAWNPDIGAASNALWRAGGMQNPNADPKAFFAIDVWPSGYSSANAPVSAARNVVIAFWRNTHAAYTGGIDMTKYIYIDMETGEIFRSADFR